jgi:hypothetical protein
LPAITGSRGRVSGAGRSLTGMVMRLPPRSTVSCVVPPMPPRREAVAEALGIVDADAVDCDDHVRRAGRLRRRPRIDHAGDHRAGRPIEPEPVGERPAVSACSRAPNQGRRTVVAPVLARSTTTRTMAEGMAKPMPTMPPPREKMAVLMPMSRPLMSISAPPELPGLIAASVWMKKPGVGDADLGARQRGDDALRHRLADAEGIADRQHEIADLQRVGIAEQGRGRVPWRP